MKTVRRVMRASRGAPLFYEPATRPPPMHAPHPPSRAAPERQPLAAVTGASGFIGRHLVRALCQDGWRVRVLMRREPDLPEWAGCELQVVPGTLGDPLALHRLVEGAD